MKWHQPAGTAIHRRVFGVIALVGLSLEFFDYSTIPMWSMDPQFLLTLAISVALAAALTWAGFRPCGGGIAVIAISIGEAMVGAGVGWPSFFLYVVVGDWIAKRWTWAGATAFVIYEIILLMNSDYAEGTIFISALSLAIAVAVGMTIRVNGDNVERLQREATDAREAAQRARDQVQEELAAQLHDTAVRDLVRLVSLNESPAETEEETRNKEALMGQIAREALRNIRAALNQIPQDRGEGAGDVVETCQRMLQARNITLIADYPHELHEVMGADMGEVFDLIVREGSTNILKYAPCGSTARLLVDGSSDEGVSIVMRNEIADGEVDPGPLSGGYGLHNLLGRVEALGGSLYSGASTGGWSLIAQFPPAPHVELPRPRQIRLLADHSDSE